MKIKILSVLLIINSLLFSQTIQKQEIKWVEPISVEGNLYLSFTNATYNENYLPIFLKKITVPSRNYTVSIENAIYKTINSNELNQQQKKMLSNIIKINSQVYSERNNRVLNIEFIPLRINNKTNEIEKLISFDLSYKAKKTLNSNHSIKTSSSSLLSSGNWMRLGVIKSGIYKVSYQDIVNSGIPNPSQIRLFGYGGEVLSEYNGDTEPDDMQEMAIKVEKGSDGIFNSGDYILFYAEGPQVWYFDEQYDQLRHKQHNYSDTIYYFLSSNIGTEKSIQTLNQVSGSAQNIDVFLDKQVHEKDDVNLLHSGKIWFGEEFNSIHESYNFSFNFPNLITDSLVRIHTAVAGRYSGYSYVSIFYNQQQIQRMKIPNVTMESATGFYVRKASSYDLFSVNSDNIDLTAKYDQYEQYNAWLNYININAVRKLKISDEQLIFSNIYNIGGLNNYIISNVNSTYQVWDISDLSNSKKINSNFSNNQLSFKLEAPQIKNYIAFQVSDAYSVASKSKIRNQNLHALENIEYIILTHSKFKQQAEEIANFHREHSNLKTKVVTNEQVYNEFSSGTPDIGALRNFMRHLYKYRSNTDTLKYLMLVGDGSYDNKTKSNSNSNYILTYQSNTSIRVNNTFVCDDFYGLLDDSEGALVGYLDIGIGRLVVNTVEEAKSAVNKITNYNSSPESYGTWRALINFVADNGDGNLHIRDADGIANLVESSYPEFNLNKIYMDAYPLEESAGGDVVPEATHDFNSAINQGTLLLNYTGHGGELGLAHEQLITIQDILSWTNSNKLATFMTATCEFTRYDDKNRTSAGEHVFLNPNGGGIALFTTTRIAYAGPNKTLNTAFYNQLFDDNTFRMGDMVRRTKNALGATSSNMRNFTLIGDPALSLAIPTQNVSTLKINNINFNDVDTFSIAPLSKVTIEGQINNNNNELLSNFNGTVYPTIFDKTDTVLTLCQFECPSPFPFQNRKNIIYKGKVSVKSGKFTFSFFVPKDISYKNGLGRISYFADNKIVGAWGYTNKLGVSGLPDSTIIDTKGPLIELYMNDENFIYGGTTDENPILIASLYDEHGINTVGNGIGHDLTSKMDNDNRKLVILNTYYESDLDSYQSGKITYSYNKLSNGKHTLQFKAWDVFNNSSEQELEFFVAESLDLSIKNIFNYPNPFTTNTDFYFDHNQANKNLEVLIQIFTVSGKLVKTIETNILTDGYRSTPINWNGKDDFNDPIGRGVYIYKLKVKTEEGESVTEFQKLVILK